MNNALFDFLAEIVIRLRAKSPKFFRVLQILSAVTAFIAGVPYVLIALGVVLPDWAVTFENKVVAIAAIVATFLNGLPVEQPAGSGVEQAPTDGTLKATKKSTRAKVIALPFTDRIKSSNG